MAMFSLTEDAKGKSLAIFFNNGDTDTIPDTHVSFKAIIEKLLAGNAPDEEIRELIQPLVTAARKLSALSERVSVDGKQVYFDGDPLAGELADVIKRMFEEGRSLDFKPLVNFLEKAATNPSRKSVDDLYRWIKKRDLVIDPDGDIVAYKGVAVGPDGTSLSIHSGTAFVNGEEVTGKIPNRPGTVISMPRNQVNGNEEVACSTGLHAGTYSYAMEFLRWNRENRLILVKINPRDVVSVPTDEQDRKMRVSRYTVLTEIDARIEYPIYSAPEEEPEDDDFEDYDEWDDEWPEEEDEEDEEYDPANDESLAEWERELLGLPPKAEEAPEEEPEPEEDTRERDYAGRVVS